MSARTSVTSSWAAVSASARAASSRSGRTSSKLGTAGSPTKTTRTPGRSGTVSEVAEFGAALASEPLGLGDPLAQQLLADGLEDVGPRDALSGGLRVDRLRVLAGEQLVQARPHVTVVHRDAVALRDPLVDLLGDQPGEDQPGELVLPARGGLGQGRVLQAGVHPRLQLVDGHLLVADVGGHARVGAAAGPPRPRDPAAGPRCGQ